MKMLRLALLMIAVVLALAAPASAVGHEPIGDRLNIYNSGSQVLTADAPFHIMHGWSIDPSERYPISTFSFELEIDGQPWEADFYETHFVPGEDYPLYRLWVHNFPDGMTGVHEFTGRWFAPCQYAVDYGLYPGPCPLRFEPVEARTTLVQVTFVP